MSLKINTRCAFCKETLDYLDTDSNKLFRSTVDHDVEACKDYLYNRVAYLEERTLDLTKRLEGEQLRSKAKDNRTHMLKQRIEELNSNLVKAPADQKKKLIAQCQRWQALYERERMRRREMRKEIMHLYGTLDFKVETGSIVDTAAKVVAEYTITKLRELTRKNR